MKRQILLSVALFFNSLSSHSNPLLVAVLMVKNEAPVMELTLQPLVDAGITDFLIYDTGSTDATIQVTQDFFIRNKISNYVIKQGEWIDFAASRNRALEFTEQYFPNATFLLMLDAEWILHNGSDLLAYCKQHKHDFATVFLIQLKGYNIEFSHARLIRNKSNVCFVGKVHEYVNLKAQARVPHHIYFELNPTHYGKEKSKNRWLRDLNLLYQEYLENPDDTRTVYYLAQTCFCLEDFENAAQWYEKRITMGGWDEELYLSTFCLAQVYSCMKMFDKMIYNYLKAFAMRPHRAEPLIRLAEYYYIIKNYELSYLFARHSVTIPYPHNEIAMIERWLYEFIRYDILSSVCYFVGDFKLGKQATLKALMVCPDEACLHENLRFYEEMLQK